MRHMPLRGSALSPGAIELESPLCGCQVHAQAGAVINRTAVEMIPAFERENRQRSLQLNSAADQLSAEAATHTKP